MTESQSSGVVRWWAALATGTAVALLITWLAHLAGVKLSTLVSIAAGAAALGWLIVLVSAPWNLYFGARRVLTEIDASRHRGVHVERLMKPRPGGSGAGCSGSRLAGIW